LRIFAEFSPIVQKDRYRIPEKPFLTLDRPFSTCYHRRYREKAEKADFPRREPQLNIAFLLCARHTPGQNEWGENPREQVTVKPVLG
jgi:hypothetical protein